jgi:hypothetical protein
VSLRNTHLPVSLIQINVATGLLQHFDSIFVSSSSSSISTTTLWWVSACSAVVEHSQQESFTECCCQRHVKPPTWRTRDLERSNFRHNRPPASEATLVNPAAKGGTMGEKWPRISPKVATYVTFGFFYMP